MNSTINAVTNTNKINTKIYEIKKKLRYSKYFNSYDPFVKLPEKKFFIFTRGRTGSTVLTDLLNSHPEMYCDYEIFFIEKNQTIVKYPLKYIDSCSKRATLNKKSVYGFKVKIEQLRDEHKYTNIDELFKQLIDKNWKIIYLKRSNIFKHTLSGLISNKTKVFHVKDSNDFTHEKIIIDCTLLYDVMKYFEGLENLEEDYMKNVPHININYETDLLDNSRHQETSDKVFNYLGLDNFPVNTKLKKIIPENLQDIISNYDEVYEAISKTDFKRFL